VPYSPRLSPQTTPRSPRLTFDSPSYSSFGDGALSPVGLCPNPEPRSKMAASATTLMHRGGRGPKPHIYTPLQWQSGTLRALLTSRGPRRRCESTHRDRFVYNDIESLLAMIIAHGALFSSESLEDF